MNKMVNKLILKRAIIRRFINDSDDSEDDSEIQIISRNDSKSDISFTQHNSSPPEESLNNKFTNYTIFVKSFGESVERFVDLNGDNNPFATKDGLNQLMACKGLTQMSTVLSQSASNSHSNQTVSKTKGQFKSNVRPKKDKKRKPKTRNESTNESTIESTIESTKELIELESRIKELELEGIHHLKAAKIDMTFKCLVCDIRVIGLQLASDHRKSDFHLKRSFGDDLKGLDALFTIDSETIGDIRIAITRKRELKKISPNDKQRLLNHGIRLKDGFGPNAYICSKCNLSFESFKEVDKHSKSDESSVCKADNPLDKEKTLDSNNKVDQKLYSEGIKATESTDGSKFYCIFCNIYFECKRIAVSHISGTRHKGQKSGENLNEIDSRFTIESNRIDELEIAFARKTALKSIPLNTKQEFTNKSIRLQDGIGSNAFLCLKCELPIGSVDMIEEHIKSLSHCM